jgi:hypothetical protein
VVVVDGKSHNSLISPGGISEVEKEEFAAPRGYDEDRNIKSRG